MKDNIYIPDVFDIMWARRADTFEEYLKRLEELKKSSNKSDIISKA